MRRRDKRSRPGCEERTDIVRCRRIEIVDDRGVTRIVLGALGDGDGRVYGIEAVAGDPSVRACVTAEDRSAGVSIVGGNETVIECRVSTHAGESPLSVELGAGGCSVATVDVSADGGLALFLARAVDKDPRSAVR